MKATVASAGIESDESPTSFDDIALIARLAFRTSRK
jgi:hypothetical protein